MAWKLPTKFPDLSGASMLAVDIETRDPSIGEKRGPGIHGRDDCYIVGVAIAAPGGFQAYYPVAHAEGVNLPQEDVFNYLRRELGREGQPKIGANIMYDLQWLETAGVHVAGPFHDVQFAEPLIDENQQHYSLEAIARKYLGVGKESDALKRAALSRGIKDANTRAYLWRFRPDEVGEYAERDCTLLFPIFTKQEQILRREGTWPVYRLECRQIPMLVSMRLRGVRVDVDAADRLRAELETKERAEQAELDKYVGLPVAVRSQPSLRAACKKLGLTIPTTKERRGKELVAKESFSKAAIGKINNRLFRSVLNIRKWNDLRTKFIEKYVLDFAIDGRVYAEFHPLRKEKDDDEKSTEGTGMGRMSSARPNLQNIPKRDHEYGALIRALFLPDEGDLWMRNDYKQIEPRVALHYGIGDAAENARLMLINDPNMDPYSMLSAMMPQLTRDQIKIAYLGTMYGMGAKKFAFQYELSDMMAIMIRAQFSAGAPYLADLAERAQNLANKTGWVKTILGRRRHFNRFEPGNWDDAQGEIPLPFDEARAKWPQGTLRRAETRTAAHAVVSGSAADVLKMAQVKIWEAGICDVVGAPLSSVHDEINFSIPQTDAGAAAMDAIVDCMENAITLRVPVLVDCGVGANWYAAS